MKRTKTTYEFETDHGDKLTLRINSAAQSEEYFWTVELLDVSTGNKIANKAGTRDMAIEGCMDKAISRSVITINEATFMCMSAGVDYTPIKNRNRGKSLSVKAASNALGVPLIKLD